MVIGSGMQAFQWIFFAVLAAVVLVFIIVIVMVVMAVVRNSKGRDLPQVDIPRDPIGGPSRSSAPQASPMDIPRDPIERP